MLKKYTSRRPRRRLLIRTRAEDGAVTGFSEFFYRRTSGRNSAWVKIVSYTPMS